MILELSVAVIAIAWVILVIYLAITLTQLKKVLQNSNRSLEKVEQMLHPIDVQTTRLLETTNLLAENIAEKSKALDPLFHSISQLTESADEVVTKFRKTHGDNSFKEKRSNKLDDILELAAMGMLLWSKYKKKE